MGSVCVPCIRIGTRVLNLKYFCLLHFFFLFYFTFFFFDFHSHSIGHYLVLCILNAYLTEISFPLFRDEHEDSLRRSLVFQPLQLPFMLPAPSIVQVACGNRFGACLSAQGSVYVFGHGALFSSLAAPTYAYTPLCVSLGLPSIRMVACGREHLAMLSDEGLVYTMGCGSDGQLGRAGATDIPQEVRLGVRCKAVACGTCSTLAVTVSGELLITGRWPFNTHSGGQAFEKIALPIVVAKVR